MPPVPPLDTGRVPLTLLVSDTEERVAIEPRPRLSLAVETEVKSDKLLVFWRKPTAAITKLEESASHWMNCSSTAGPVKSAAPAMVKTGSEEAEPPPVVMTDEVESELLRIG